VHSHTTAIIIIINHHPLLLRLLLLLVGFCVVRFSAIEEREKDLKTHHHGTYTLHDSIQFNTHVSQKQAGNRLERG
jgi:hypothetical protein